MGNSVAKGAKGRTTSGAAAPKGRTQLSRKPAGGGDAKAKVSAKKPAGKAGGARQPAAAKRVSSANRSAAPQTKGPTKKTTQPAKGKTRSEATAAKAPAISAKTTSHSGPKTKRQPERATAPTPAPPKAPAKGALPQVGQRTSVVLKAFEAALKLFNKGQFREAQGAFEHLLERYPDHTDIAARVNTFIAICKTRTRSMPKLPQNADTLYDQGVLELNRGHFESAMGFFERALKTQPGEAHILYSLAAAQVRAGEVEAGLESLERAIQAREVYRSRARTDLDFDSIRAVSRFRELVGGFWDGESY